MLMIFSFIHYSHKLRRILRKCLLISEKMFNNINLLFDTIPVVIDILGDTYIEMKSNHKNILDLVSHENEVFTALRRSSGHEVKKMLEECPALEELDLITSPGVCLGYNELKNFKNNTTKLNASEVVFKLYDTYGLDDEAISTLTRVFDLKYDKKEFENLLNNARQRTKNTFLNVYSSVDKKSEFLQKAQNLSLPRTNDTFKYNYSFDDKTNTFSISNLNSLVLAIIDDEYNFHSDTQNIGETFKIVLDKTNFFSEAGGQESDLGVVKMNDVEFEVISVECIDKYVLHTVRRKTDTDKNLQKGSIVEMYPDETIRNGNICNHTGL